MKAFFRFLSVFLFLIVACFVLLNTSNTIAIETDFFSLRTNVGFLVLLCAALSSIASILLVMTFSSSAKTKNLKKQAEEAKLNYEVESDKVKQLEAKITTLEQALKTATNKT